MSQALRDFDAVLKLRPDFDQALIQRGRILLKECRIDEALIDLKTYWLSNPKEEEVLQMIADAESAAEDRKAVYGLVKTKQTEPALETLSRLVIVCPLYTDWRLMRAELYLEANDLVMAASDLSRVAAIRPSTDIYHRIAILRLKMGELNDALGAIKDCMKHDPENRPCKTVFKQIRALDKAYEKVEKLFNQTRWKSAVTELHVEKGYLELAEQSGSDAMRLKAYTIACKSYFELNKMTEAEKYCTKVLSLDESNFDALFMRGELRLRNEKYEDAARDLEKAHNVNQQDRRVIESYQKAQRLLSQSKKKDYYKVLGVSRHPDKYVGELSHDQVVEKMSAINEAYEVLSDEGKRD
ncbi:DnaJ sub C member 3 [Entophlyctis luteolus]|nr:DnaJ sub C member 3 [Entophlyctis luteolus]